MAGRGKRGGLRVIYFLRAQRRNLDADAGREECRGQHSCEDVERRSRRRSMPKAKRNTGQEILEGIRQLKRGERGRVMKVPSVAAIREKAGLSQPRFAESLGVSVRTLQEWAQGRRAPSGAARTLPLIAEKNPRAFLDVA
jgi:putative transcriptional regulator